MQPLLVRVSPAFFGLSVTTLVLAQGPSPGSQVEPYVFPMPVARELPPPVVVYPGEILTLRTEVPHDPGYWGWVPEDPPEVSDPDWEWIEFGRWEKGFWRADGGTVVSADERTIIYQAPSHAGLWFLQWNDGVSEPIWFAFVVPGADIEWDFEIELPMEQLDGFDGSFLPSAGGNSFRIFAVHPCSVHLSGGDRPCGQGYHWAGNLRLVPSERPSDPCKGQGSLTSVYNYKVWEFPEHREVAGSGTLWGLRVIVYRVINKERHARHWDCYECRDGSWRWCGNRSQTWIVERITYQPPSLGPPPETRTGKIKDRASGCCLGWKQPIRP